MSFFSKVLSYRNFDSHHIIRLFGLTISIRHESKFNYIPADKTGINNSSAKPQIIVSLTSYPKRIDAAVVTINTLLKQSLKPNRLILWLAEEQFPNKEKDLPEDLLKLRDFGLEIRWCKNLLSYKKIIPALKEFPDDIIVTADDDLYYEETWLESLYQEYLKDTKNIYARRAKKVKLEQEKIKLCRKYEQLEADFGTPSFLNQLMSGAGCLFPPHSLYKDIFNENDFMTLLPTNDDIYIWCMSVLNRTKIYVVNNNCNELISVQGTENEGLCKINKKNSCGLAPNDAIQTMTDKYPELINILGENS